MMSSSSSGKAWQRLRALFRPSTCVNSADFGTSTVQFLQSVDPVLGGTGCFNQIQCKQNVFGLLNDEKHEPTHIYIFKQGDDHGGGGYNYSTYKQIHNYVQSSPPMRKMAARGETLACTRKKCRTRRTQRCGFTHRRGSRPQKGIVREGAGG